MASLDPKRIAVATLALVDDRGPDALTIRAVADALGVAPMSIYYHVENKSALVALLVELALSERPLPIPSGNDWREDLWEMSVWMREGSKVHPAVTQLLQRYNVWTPSMLALGEHWITLWQRAGFDFETATRAARASGAAIIGYINHEVTMTRYGTPDDSMLGWSPHVRSAIAMPVDPSDGFELVARSVIEGISNFLSSSPGERSQPSNGAQVLTDTKVPAEGSGPRRLKSARSRG
jgi:AcrR family transcriptional regulator